MKKRRAVPANFVFGLTCLVVFGLAFSAYSQQYSSTLQVPVTFYDFWSDRSNPEFEVPHAGGRREGMVATVLDADKKPVMGNIPYLNHGIRFWFRDWNNLEQYNMKDSIMPNGRSYLEKFRPIYMYNGNGNNGFPPPLRTTVSDEWNVVVNNNNAPPYIYHTNMTGYPANTASVAGGDSVRLNGSTAGGNSYVHTVKDAFKNIVIDTSLTFTHVGNGMYRIEIGPNFFPLNGRGEQAGGPNQNFWKSTSGTSTTHSDYPKNVSYTMEMVYNFKMVPNLVFNFTGDDDVWVFINDRLALDIGGIHSPVSGSIHFNNIRNSHNLEDGNHYSLRMFYCERHSSDASIQITTNATNVVIENIGISIKSDTLKAGDTTFAWATVTSDSGTLTTYDGTFAWDVTDIGPGGNQKPMIVRGNKGSTAADIAKSDTVWFTATRAYTNLFVEGSYTQQGNVPVSGDATVYVKPGDPAAVFIEQFPDSMATQTNRWAPSLVDTVRISSSAMYAAKFYAIVRDRFGNWVQPAAAFSQPGNPPYTGTVQWTSRNTNIVSIPSAADFTALSQLPFTDPQWLNIGRGEGRVNRVNSGITGAVVRFNISPSNTFGGGAFTDTVPVLVNNETYPDIRIGIKVGGPNGTFVELARSGSPGDTLHLTVNTDTTLYVQMLTSTGTWIENVAGIWGATSPAGVANWLVPAPPSATNWTFCPTAQGDGNVTVYVPGGTTTFAQLPIKARLSDPVAMRFYSNYGAPGTANVSAYPQPSQAITIRAGRDTLIVAKLFADLAASANMWLSGFEAAAPARVRDSISIKWGFAPTSPVNDSTVLIHRSNNTPRGEAIDSGIAVRFRSTVAHQTYILRASYTYNGVVMQRELHIDVVPDWENAKLHIEPNSQGFIQSPNRIQPLDTLSFASNDQATKQVYAVLRDQYQNFIGFSGGTFQYGGTSVTTGPTNWAGSDNAVFEHAKGFAEDGQCHITKVNAGVAKLAVTDAAYPNLRDSIYVRVLEYFYDTLKIAVRVNCDGFNAGASNGVQVNTECYEWVVSSLTKPFTMDSNRDTVFYVFGHVNSGGGDKHGTWEPVTATWGRSDGLEDALRNPPNNTNSWAVSPASTGEGLISVRRQLGTSTGGLSTTFIQDSIYVKITTGPPLWVELEILNTDNLIAGEPITGVLRYRNRAGVITAEAWAAAGWGAFPAYFGDILSCGGCEANERMPEPKIGSTGDTILGYAGIANPHGTYSILPADPNASVGPGDVTFRIYYASSDMHQIRFLQEVLGVQLTVLSNPFFVRAAGLAEIVIVDEKEVPVDTLVEIPYPEPRHFYSVGYDQYGNKIGWEQSDWKLGQGGTIPPLKGNTTGVVMITYETKDANENGEGWIIAETTDKDGIKIRDSVLVRITGVTTTLLSAATRDLDANGYLDRIELRFAKPVAFEWNSDSARSRVKIRGNRTHVRDDFVVKSVAINPDSAQLVTVSIEENPAWGLQTDWNPFVTVEEGAFKDVRRTTLGPNTNNSIDGAAPVIATAVKFFAQKSGEPDWVDVTFSENLRTWEGRSYTEFATDTRYNPNTLFNIYEKKSAQAAKRLSRTAAVVWPPDTLNLLKDFFSDIVDIIPRERNTLRFFLKEGTDVGTRHFMNVKMSHPAGKPDSSFIGDSVSLTVTNVLDVISNRVVPVTFGNDPPQKIKAIPNPSSPDANAPRGTVVGGQLRPGDMDAFHNDRAAQHVREGGGGSILRVPVYIPKGADKPGNRVRCQVKVYDLVGNLVNTAKTDNLAANSGFTGSNFDNGNYTEMDLFWNGYNSKGMKVAPGTYRMIVFIDYENASDRNRNKKFQGTLGISK
ncbi:MAG: fibro-slime domain-containing protein [Chitinispirillales bacterium]|jgi:fibro-slime domain-containing protein|nr:fibro-slime domain-containing protein [Chitinispirillales bacterium]